MPVRTVVKRFHLKEKCKQKFSISFFPLILRCAVKFLETKNVKAYLTKIYRDNHVRNHVSSPLRVRMSPLR